MMGPNRFDAGRPLYGQRSSQGLAGRDASSEPCEITEMAVIVKELVAQRPAVIEILPDQTLHGWAGLHIGHGRANLRSADEATWV
jgi:hypothetical protein